MSYTARLCYKSVWRLLTSYQARTKLPVFDTAVSRQVQPAQTIRRELRGHGSILVEQLQVRTSCDAFVQSSTESYLLLPESFIYRSHVLVHASFWHFRAPLLSNITGTGSRRLIWRYNWYGNSRIDVGSNCDGTWHLLLKPCIVNASPYRNRR